MAVNWLKYKIISCVMLPLLYRMLIFFQNSSSNCEIINSNGGSISIPTNPVGIGGVSGPVNEQVLAIKQGQLKMDANNKLSNSHTLDSLNELQVSKTGTPSMISR